MKEIEHVNSYKAAEVKLTYVTKQKPSDRFKIKDSNDAAELFFEIWNMETIEFIEEVKMVLLNRDNQVLGIANISTGGISSSIIDTRVILQYAIKSNATSVILAHNHPSGNASPSEADKHITRKIRDALKTCDISLLDHLIITKERGQNSIIDLV